jgi:hypothetical protein
MTSDRQFCLLSEHRDEPRVALHRFEPVTRELADLVGHAIHECSGIQEPPRKSQLASDFEA